MRDASVRLAAAVLSLSTAAGCSSVGSREGDPTPQVSSAVGTTGENPVNAAAGRVVLYELQLRTANACDPSVGSPDQQAACAKKPAPAVPYRVQGGTCASLPDLQKIRLGTVEDAMEDTADYKAGITLRYVAEQVGANAIWIMPPFPNNDAWNVPDPCDNLGSPYAVRDYLHVSGRLSRACIAAGRDEDSAVPCYGNASFDALIQAAHGRGLRVMLDVAFNHFGHNYEMFDYAAFTPVRDWSFGSDPQALWDFAKTYDARLLHPEVLDTVDGLSRAAAADAYVRGTLAALRNRCPALAGAALVNAFHAYREAFDGERAAFDCSTPYLEFQAPGFYLGTDGLSPSTHIGDDFQMEWPDVKFLFHHEESTAHYANFVRTREYMFRVLNYWVSRGVDGFRFDHASDPRSGLGANEWKYVVDKANFYAQKRGQAVPIYLSEDFADPQELDKVSDVLTEGYVTDMNGRYGVTKDTARLEWIVSNMDRFQDHAYIMTALETHDEKRLLDGTGFDVWTGAGFWGIGATTRSTPMLLAGQELGESYGLAFRRSDYLRSRFDGSATWSADSPALLATYHTLVTQRLAPENRALVGTSRAFMRTDQGAVDPRIFAMARWTADGSALLVFHNLWEQAVAARYVLSADVVAAFHLDAAGSYRLVDALAPATPAPCVSGATLLSGVDVTMDKATRARWLRVEACP